MSDYNPLLKTYFETSIQQKKRAIKQYDLQIKDLSNANQSNVHEMKGIQDQISQLQDRYLKLEEENNEREKRLGSLISLINIIKKEMEEEREKFKGFFPEPDPQPAV